MWIPVTSRLPDENVVVETKIVDEKGERNVQLLKRKGYLWFFPDMSMYVYYSPTHWRDPNKEKKVRKLYL